MKRTILHILTGLCFIVGFALYIICVWSSNLFGVGIDEIIFTITSPLKGADTNVLASALRFCLPRLLAVAILYTVFALVDLRYNISAKIIITLKKRIIKINLRRILAFLSIFSIFASLFYINNVYKVVDYFKSQSTYTTIYEDYYVSP